MTESIYICAGTLCCALVVCALVRMLSPSGNTTKILSAVIGIFALCAILSSFTEFLKGIDMPNVAFKENITSQEFSELCDEQVLTQTADYINQYTQTLIDEADIEYKNIETVVGVSDDTGIYIKAMNIYISESTVGRSDEIRELISSSVGVKPNIITE